MVVKPWRAVGAVTLGLMCSVGLAACTDEATACPAIGYVHVLTVALDGDQAEDVTLVQLCRGSHCEPDQDTEAAHPAVLVAMWSQDGNTWTYTLLDRPEQITVRALDSDGGVLSDTDITPDWVRVGGDARCGGPHEATVAVDV